MPGHNLFFFLLCFLSISVVSVIKGKIVAEKSTGNDHSRHHEAIVDQFTRQAVPFAQKLEHSQQEAMELMLKMSGVTASVPPEGISPNPWSRKTRSALMIFQRLPGR